MADHSRRTGRARVTVDGAATAPRPPRERARGRDGGSSAPTVERITTTGGSATLDPNVAVSFVGAQPEGRPAFLTIHLPDGTVDGFQKTVVFSIGKLLEVDYYRLRATFDEVPVGGALSFPSGGGGAVLVWNAEEGYWQTAGVYLSST